MSARSAAGSRYLVVVTVLAAILLVSLRGAAAASLNATSARLTPYRVCVVTATPSSTTSVIDASVRQASATTNYGTSTTNDVASASSANRRLYLRFNLATCSPAIPASAVIRVATLRLYASTVATACRTLDIFRVTATWTESGATWNNQPFGTAINNPASGSRTDSFDVGTTTGCANIGTGYVTGADVTTDVAAFVSGSATNYGWMIRDDSEGSATARTTTSSAKDLGTLARAPQLIVAYVAVP